jgi:hypothetical protein
MYYLEVTLGESRLLPSEAGEIALGAEESEALTESEIQDSLTQLLRDESFKKSFIPENAFSEQTGLFKIDDYKDSLVRHLPDIYLESLRARRYLREYLTSQSASVLGRLEVSLEHAARYHVCFLFFALQRLADENGWD